MWRTSSLFLGIKNVFFSKWHFWEKNYTLSFTHFFSILSTVVGERVGKSSAICIDFASQVFLFTPPNLFSLCLPSFLSIQDRLCEKQDRFKTLLTILRHLNFPDKMPYGHSRFKLWGVQLTQIFWKFNCMQNDVTSVAFCLQTFGKKTIVYYFVSTQWITQLNGDWQEHLLLNPLTPCLKISRIVRWM